MTNSWEGARMCQDHYCLCLSGTQWYFQMKVGFMVVAVEPTNCELHVNTSKSQLSLGSDSLVDYFPLTLAQKQLFIWASTIQESQEKGRDRRKEYTKRSFALSCHFLMNLQTIGGLLSSPSLTTSLKPFQGHFPIFIWLRVKTLSPRWGRQRLAMTPAREQAALEGTQWLLSMPQA
jgi:hypothetical protein